MLGCTATFHSGAETLPQCIDQLDCVSRLLSLCLYLEVLAVALRGAGACVGGPKTTSRVRGILVGVVEERSRDDLSQILLVLLGRR